MKKRRGICKQSSLRIGSDGIEFTEDENAVATMKSKDMFNLQNYATAQNCFDAMVEEYGLEGYDTETALKVGAIRYELTRLMFSIENPVTIADDVSDRAVATIKRISRIIWAPMYCPLLTENMQIQLLLLIF